VVTAVTAGSSTIVLETKEENKEYTWEKIKEVLPANEPRYAVMDVAYKSDDGREQNKLTFVFWSPDGGASVKEKMLYAATKDSIKKIMSGCMKEVQANEMVQAAASLRRGHCGLQREAGEGPGAEGEVAPTGLGDRRARLLHGQEVRSIRQLQRHVARPVRAGGVAHRRCAGAGAGRPPAAGHRVRALPG